jgi:hypothetical protein
MRIQGHRSLVVGIRNGHLPGQLCGPDRGGEGSDPIDPGIRDGKVRVEPVRHRPVERQTILELVELVALVELVELREWANIF